VILAITRNAQLSNADSFLLHGAQYECIYVTVNVLVCQFVVVMGAHRHGQEGAVAPPLPPRRNDVKCFCALVHCVSKKNIPDVFSYNSRKH